MRSHMATRLRLAAFSLRAAHLCVASGDARADAQLDHRHLWHPFTQQRDWATEEPLVIERGRGDRADRRRRAPLYRRRLLALVQRPRPPPPGDRRRRCATSSTGSPTRPCSGSPTPAPPSSPPRLVEIAPPGLSRVFYSDSGSTAVEIALKMAFQYWQQRGGQRAGRPRSSASRTPTTATRSARSRSAGSTSSTAPSGPLLFEAHRVEPGDLDDLERLLDHARARRSRR